MLGHFLLNFSCHLQLHKRNTGYLGSDVICTVIAREGYEWLFGLYCTSLLRCQLSEEVSEWCGRSRTQLLLIKLWKYIQVAWVTNCLITFSDVATVQMKTWTWSVSGSCTPSVTQHYSLGRVIQGLLWQRARTTQNCYPGWLAIYITTEGYARTSFSKHSRQGEEEIRQFSQPTYIVKEVYDLLRGIQLINSIEQNGHNVWPMIKWLVLWSKTNIFESRLNLTSSFFAHTEREGARERR